MNTNNLFSSLRLGRNLLSIFLLALFSAQKIWAGADGHTISYVREVLVDPNHSVRNQFPILDVHQSVIELYHPNLFFKVAVVPSRGGSATVLGLTSDGLGVVLTANHLNDRRIFLLNGDTYSGVLRRSQLPYRNDWYARLNPLEEDVFLSPDFNAFFEHFSIYPPYENDGPGNYRSRQSIELDSVRYKIGARLPALAGYSLINPDNFNKGHHRVRDRSYEEFKYDFSLVVVTGDGGFEKSWVGDRYLEMREEVPFSSKPIRDFFFPTLEIAEPIAGEKIIALGFPEQMDKSYFNKNLPRKTSDLVKFNNNQGYSVGYILPEGDNESLPHTLSLARAIVDHGMSGGAVFNTKGQYLGIIVAKDQDKNAEPILTFLKATEIVKILKSQLKEIINDQVKPLESRRVAQSVLSFFENIKIEKTDGCLDLLASASL